MTKQWKDMTKKEKEQSIKGIAFIFIFIFIFLWLSGTFNSNKTSKNNLQIETPSLSVNAEQLIQDYLSNQISANEKYQNKIASVGGIIYEVGEDWSGGNYVILRKEYEYNGVQCEFNTPEELTNLHKGQYITLKGKIIGFTNGLVLIDDCSVVN